MARTLSPEERRAVAEAVAGGMSYRRAAKQFGCSVYQVKVAVEQARGAGMDPVGERLEQVKMGAAMARAEWEAEREAVRGRTWRIASLASTELVRRLETDPASIEVRDLVGVLTRAVHDAALLSGEATERTEAQERREILGRLAILSDEELRELAELPEDDEAAP